MILYTNSDDKTATEEDCKYCSSFQSHGFVKLFISGLQHIGLIKQILKNPVLGCPIHHWQITVSAVPQVHRITMETRKIGVTTVGSVVVFILLCSKFSVQAQDVEVCRRNDESTQSLFRFRISESAPADAVIGNLSFEGYAGNNSEPNISLELIQGFEHNSHVYIDEELKALRLVDAIDADGDPRIDQLRVQVSCLPLTNGDARHLTYTVFVEVMDENDNAPQFIGAPYSFNLSEMAEPRTVVYRGVQAEDIDASSNGRILYKVLPNQNDPDPSQYFNFLSSGKPDLYLLRQLDYETKQSWEFLIEASDSGAVPNMNTTTITVTVLDGDDHGPVFFPCMSSGNDTQCSSFDYLANITEKMALDEPLTFWPGQIEARDGDEGVINPKPIYYSFGEGEPSNYAEYLSIGPFDGNVTLLKPVRHSEIQEFRITLTASEGNSSDAMTLTTRVIITVREINVHSPQFAMDSVLGYVKEGAALGSPVWTSPEMDMPLILVATDPDLGEDEVFRVSYMLNDPSGAFILAASNSTEARVVTNAVIDRETVDSYTLKMMAVESSTTAQFVSDPIMINITVLDTNDNPPVFQPNEYSTAPDRYSAVIRQNLTAGSVIMQLGVSDVDTAPRIANYTYHLETLSHFTEGSPFEEMSQNTVVKIVLVRDASEIPRGDYILSLQAADVDNPWILSIKVMIDIRVIGVNEARGPVFDQEQYESFTTEGALIGSSIITIEARSLDDLPIHYSFLGTEDTFVIGDLSGVIRLSRRLDRETQAEHTVTVRAESGGKFAVTRVVVKVVDVNDNSPKLNSSVPSVFLIVEGQTDFPVGQISAYDIDEPGTLNSKVQYSLESEYFKIDADTGAISTTDIPLMVDGMERVELAVTLRDMGSPQMSSVGNVAVIVQDPDNFQPEFEYPSYEVDIPENMVSPNFLKLKVLARTLPDTHTFDLLGGDESWFRLNTTTGSLSLLAMLDYEAQKSYSLKVSVTDGNNNTDATNITVFVTDENDHAPTFIRHTFDGTYDAFAPADTVVADDIEAFDLDEPGSQNSFISYSLLSLGETVFKLANSSSPVIVTAKHLNLTHAVFRLTIIAADHGTPSLTSQAEVIITPRLMQPVFDQNPIRVTNLYEGMPGNSLVTTVKARSNVGDVVRYSIISGNAGGVFAIRSENNIGDIYTTKELDRESRSSYTLQVLAEVESESSVIRKRRALDPSIVQVMIEVGDVNDNPPTFAEEVYYAGVSLTANIGSLVTIVKASDADAEPGEILYGIELLSNNQSKFRMLQRTGVLVTTDTFSEDEAEMTFTLMVVAEDQSSAQLQEATTLLLVSVINSTNRIVISINLTTDVVEEQRDRLEMELSMLFSAHAFVEDVSQRRTGLDYQQFDPSSSDISVFVLEDVTARPWHNNNTLKTLQERRGQLDEIFLRLMPEGNITEVRKPIDDLERGLVVVKRGHAPEGVLLLILAVIILFLTILACVIILISWKKREREREENRMYLPMQYSTFNPYKQSTEDLEIEFDDATLNIIHRSNPVFFEGQDSQSMHTDYYGTLPNGKHREAPSQVELFPNGATAYLREKEIQEYSIEFGPEDDEATAVAKRIIHNGTLDTSELNGSVGSVRDSPPKPAKLAPVSYEHSTSQEPLIAPDTPVSDEDGTLDDTPLPPPPDFSLPNVPEQPSRRAPSPPLRSPSPTLRASSPPLRDYSNEGTLPADTVLPSYDNHGLDLGDEQDDDDDNSSNQDPPATTDDTEPLTSPAAAEGGGDTIRKMIRRASRKGSLLLKENSKIPATGHYDPKTPQGHVDTDDLHVALIRVSQSEEDLTKVNENPMTTFKLPQGADPPKQAAIANNYVSMVSPAPFRSPEREVTVTDDMTSDLGGEEPVAASVNDNLREYEELQAGASSFDEWESEGSTHSTKL